MKSEETNIDDQITFLAHRKAELEMEVENRKKERAEFLLKVSQADAIIAENLLRISEIDKLFS